MKYYVIIAFIAIVASLGSAMVYMLRGRGAKDGNGMAWALTWRVGLSLTLFLSILLFYKLGWIAPTGIKIPT